MALHPRYFDQLALRKLVLAAPLVLAACASAPTETGRNQASTIVHSQQPEQHAIAPRPAVVAIPSARIVATEAPLQCVPYARQVTNFAIRGDAWTWWEQAAGRYRRDNRPAVGSILSLKRTDQLKLGHIAVVSRLLNSREILVEHANWLNRGQIHQHTLVRDTSRNNDWSAVRIWYTPGNTLGKRAYAAHGFIHPKGQRAMQLIQPVMRGPDVRLLQEQLKANGLNVTADGIFGPNTHAALVAYQRRAGLPADGVAGTKTRASLGL